jgi:hypothetical protein
VGRNTPPGGFGPTQVSQFNIANMLQPLRVAEYTFERFSTSEAELDHHAFGYYAEHGLLGMPVGRVFVERVDQDGDGYSETRRSVYENLLAVFSVDAAAANPAERLVLETEILHGTPVRRSGYIGDKLYSIANDSVKVVDVDDLDTLVDELAIPQPEPEPPITPIPIPWPIWMVGDAQGNAALAPEKFPASRTDMALVTAADRARADLAGRLQLGSGAPMLVTAEATPNAPGKGYDLVYRVGDDHYLYRAGAGGNAQLVDEDYTFAPDAEAWHDVESTFTAAPIGTAGDYNNDGLVNQSDRAVWQASFGSWSLIATLPADGNRDGVVDLADYVVWRNANAAGGTSAALAPLNASSESSTAALSIALESIDSTATLSTGPSLGRRAAFDPAARSVFEAPHASQLVLVERAPESVALDEESLLTIALLSDNRVQEMDYGFALEEQGSETSDSPCDAMDEAFGVLASLI